jgi:hypothetical protein
MRVTTAYIAACSSFGFRVHVNVYNIYIDGKSLPGRQGRGLKKFEAEPCSGQMVMQSPPSKRGGVIEA